MNIKTAVLLSVLVLIILSVTVAMLKLTVATAILVGIIVGGVWGLWVTKKVTESL